MYDKVRDRAMERADGSLFAVALDACGQSTGLMHSYVASIYD
jgi:hypothetical protein